MVRGAADEVYEWCTNSGIADSGGVIGCIALVVGMLDETVEEAMIGKVYILGSLGSRRAPVVFFRTYGSGGC